MKSGIEVHGFSHITGGGMFDNLERILSDDLAVTVDISSWGVPPVFEYLLSFADVEKNERYRTFNMGIGFVVILPKDNAEKVTSLLQHEGETVYQIGHIHKRDGEVVTLIG
jgi:phosphoribosylformylglycinamidine cyclo-ligase